MGDAADYTPESPELRELWLRLSPRARRRRLEKARERESAVKQVKKRGDGVSEAAAVTALGPGFNRSSFRRWQQRYEVLGFEGLLDRRIPPCDPTPERVQQTICEARRLLPRISAEEIASHLKEHHDFTTTASTVNRILSAAGLNRRRGPTWTQTAAIRRLELGGMKLVEGAAVETGYVDTLAQGITAEVEAAPLPQEGTAVDRSDRDELGRFLPSYNERYRKGSEAEVAPGFASIEETRKGLIPSRLHLAHSRPAIIERKLYGLLVSPLIGSGRWDGMRVARGELLGELCGYAYMPSTLDLFTRELKQLGVASTLWEIHARRWLQMTKHWGDERRAAVLYVDGTTKPVWTDLYSESSKVSSVGRVMPALETVAFHSGYGVPLWLVTHSGRAPLVKVVPEYLQRLSAVTGDTEVGRIVIIDAEGNAIPFVKGLEQGRPSRRWITRLKGAFVHSKYIFNRTNYKPYRNGDRIRMGLADFPDPDGGTFRMRVIEIERRTKGSVTYLGASERLSDRDWKAEDIADLYFERWPQQEANFRAVNQAVGCKDVHGYGKQLIDNVSVVTKLDEVSRQHDVLTSRGRRMHEELNASEKALHENDKELRRIQRRSETVNRHLGRIRAGQQVSPRLARLAAERVDLDKRLRRKKTIITRIQKKTTSARSQIARIRQRADAKAESQASLKSRQRIFRHDVELDSLFSLLKFGLVLLVTYVLKEYLNDAAMAPMTFLERVATMPATLRCTPQLEIVTFDYNRRDPVMMSLLTDCREALNNRRLRMRSGRILRIEVEKPPPQKRPAPKRVKTVAQTTPS